MEENECRKIMAYSRGYKMNKTQRLCFQIMFDPEHEIERVEEKLNTTIIYWVDGTTTEHICPSDSFGNTVFGRFVAAWYKKKLGEEKFKEFEKWVNECERAFFEELPIRGCR